MWLGQCSSVVGSWKQFGVDIYIYEYIIEFGQIYFLQRRGIKNSSKSGNNISRIPTQKKKKKQTTQLAMVGETGGATYQEVLSS